MAAQKRIKPTVGPKQQVFEGPKLVVLDQSKESASRSDAAEPSLPPITHIKPPTMRHLSTKIRWYLGLGYTVKEVSNLLGVRYQQVRNVAVQEPKRAAREDVPPYVIELYDVEDDLEAMEHHALEQQMAAQREQDRKARKTGGRK